MAAWGGLDPLQRTLRAIAVVSFLAMLFVVVLDPDRANNGQLLVLLFGSTLVSLGYPVVMRLPGVGSKPLHRPEGEDHDAD